MKTWNRPAAVGQKFAANDYVSACYVTVVCDYWPKGISGMYRQLVVPDEVHEVVGGDNKYYERCYTQYVQTVDATTQLKTVTFTQALNGPNDDDIGEHQAYYWMADDTEGNPDFHVTAVTPELAAAVAGSKS